MKIAHIEIVAALAFVARLASAAEPRDEVDVTAGVVTTLSCALEAKKTGDLAALGSCVIADAKTELVVYDLAEKSIYRISKKKVFRYELESAFGGGNIDIRGVVRKVEKKTAIATIDVDEYSVTPRPKPGAFKGCL